MKKIKRILAITMMLALLVPMAFGLTASAAGSITVKPQNSIKSLNGGTEFKAFQIFTLTTDGDAYDYELNSVYAGFQAAYASVLDTLTLKEYIESLTDPLNPGQILPGSEGDMYELARALWMWSDDSTNGVSPAIGAVDGNNAKFTGLDAGYYVVAGTGKPSTTETVMSFAMLCTLKEDENLEINVKADSPTIDKEVWYHNVGSDPTNTSDAGWGEWTDVNMNDTVYFKHESAVPVMTGYDIYWFIVHDSMSEGLTLDKTSFKVTVGSNTLTKVDDESDFTPNTAQYFVIEDDDYDAYTSYTNGTNFAIVINPDWFVGQTEGVAIIITYEAVLNENAVIAGTGNPNKVYLEYSNNPFDTGGGSYGDGETEDTPEDEVWVYTFKLDIFKFTGANPEEPENGDPLAGAEFELYIGDAETGEYVTFFLIVEGDEDNPAEYRVAMEDDTPTTDTLITPESGLINIIGLDEGTYYLVETQPPASYNPNPTPREIVIVNVDIDASHEVEYTIDDNTPVDFNEVPADVNIYNGSGQEFPGTGGIGRTIFIVVGLTLMVGAVVTLVVRRRVVKTF